MGSQTRQEILQGTLDLLILRALQEQVLHGWAISERIQQISENVLQVNQGSLYPALHRLEGKGWIRAEPGVSELGRRARFYRITAAGRRQLQIEHEGWRKMSLAINRVLERA
jgi:transcriptional regulator